MNELDEPSPELLYLLDAFMSEKAVRRVTSLSRTSIHRKRLAGEFPNPEPISEGRVAYRVRDIKAWLDSPQTWRRTNSLDSLDI